MTNNICEEIPAEENDPIRDQILSLEKRFKLACKFNGLSAEYKETLRLLAYFYNYYMKHYRPQMKRNEAINYK